VLLRAARPDPVRRDDAPEAGADQSADRGQCRQRAGGNNGCIEVSPLRDGIALRDSKDPEGPVLTYTHHEWSAFLDGAKKGEFDHLTRP